jgi:hypothetical protein
MRTSYSYLHCKHIVTCKDPGPAIAVINYTGPAMEGSNITIICSVDDTRMNLTTDNTLMCINGQWEPNFGEVLAGCRGINYIIAV